MNPSSNVGELIGAEAVKFATKNLRIVRSNPYTWEIEYIDDATSDIWIMDHPRSAAPGRTLPRLRKK